MFHACICVWVCIYLSGIVNRQELNFESYAKAKQRYVIHIRTTIFLQLIDSTHSCSLFHCFIWHDRKIQKYENKSHVQKCFMYIAWIKKALQLFRLNKQRIINTNENFSNLNIWQVSFGTAVSNGVERSTFNVQRIPFDRQWNHKCEL